MAHSTNVLLMLRYGPSPTIHSHRHDTSDGLVYLVIEDDHASLRISISGTTQQLGDLLHRLGSELATPPEAEYEGMFKVGEAQVAALEHLMDHCQKDLTPLKSFTLPGGAVDHVGVGHHRHLLDVGARGEDLGAAIENDGLDVT